MNIQYHAVVKGEALIYTYKNRKFMLTVSYTSNTILQLVPRAQVYLIAGPTGAGKTNLANTLAEQIGAKVIGMDNYFLDEEKVPIEHSEVYGNAPQWDSPDACDFELLVHNVSQLITNGKTRLPVFSFPINKRVGNDSVEISRGTPLIIEGLHAIRCKSFIDDITTTFSIYIDADTSIRVARIRSRDKQERDRPDHLFEKRFHFIQNAEEKWIKSQLLSANLVIKSREDYTYELQNRS